MNPKQKTPEGIGLQIFWIGALVLEWLKVEANLTGKRSGRHIVRAAERGKKVVQGIFARQVNDGQAGAPLIVVAVKNVVVTNR